MKKNNRLEPEDSICEMASYEQQYLKPIEIASACISVNAITGY